MSTTQTKRGRKPADNPRRHTVALRLTDAELAAVDARRGQTRRGTWLRRLIAAALGG